MSEQAPPPGHASASAPPPPPPGTAKDDEGFPLGLVLLGVLVLYGVLFAVFNADEVEVSFVVFSAQVSLVLALVLALVIGFFAGYLFRELRVRQRRRAASAKK